MNDGGVRRDKGRKKMKEQSPPEDGKSPHDRFVALCKRVMAVSRAEIAVWEKHMETEPKKENAQESVNTPSATGPLSSSLLKVMRASQQIGELGGRLKTFLDTNPYRIVRNVDHEAGRATFVTNVREPCPPMWSVWIGECIHNLRSALDYMVWDLVILETGSPPTTNKSQFPIFLSEAGYNERTKPLLKGVGSKPRAVIRALQPFSTGENERSPLWHLHELSNWDKHRSLRLTGAYLHEYDWLHMPDTTTPGNLTGMEARAPGPFQHGTVLLTVRFSGGWQESTSNVDVDAKGTFDIAFDQTGPIPGAVVIPALVNIHQRVFEVGKQLAELWPARHAAPPDAEAAAV